jgi:hypothetical protein
LDLLALEQQLLEQALLAGTVQILHLQQLEHQPLAAEVAEGLPALFMRQETAVLEEEPQITTTLLRLVALKQLVKAMLVEAF